MAKREPVEILVIADRSGSMGSIRAEAIGGFNNFLTAQKAVKGAANLTLVLFDDQYEVPINGVKLKEVEPLTTETFVPRGMTALYDAVGKALASLEAKAPKKAVICILTDGAENASKEYTHASVQERVKAAEARGWEIVFLAANIDAKAAGASLGITRGASIAFAANGLGVTNAYADMSTVATGYRRSAS